MNQLSDWTLVRSFLEVWRHGSLSAAARATGLTQPTIGRHIDQIEQGLGIGLFTRSSGGLIATEAALALVPHALAMESSMAALVRASQSGGDSDAPRGTVRIAASEIIGLSVLPDILADFRLAQPHITFELVLNNRNDDLLRRDADIAIRMARPTQEGLVARKIGDFPLAFYAHRRYLDHYGVPGSLDELLSKHLVGFDRDDHSARSVARDSLPITRDIFTFRSDHDGAQLAAMLSGVGIGVMAKAIARRYPDMMPLLHDTIGFKLEIWLVIHEDQRNQPAIRAVLDGLARGLSHFIAP